MNLTLVLTHQCNLACHYCYAGEKMNRKMTWETARKAIDHAIAAPGSLLDLAYFGGEPLLEWELLQRTFRYARDEAARVGKRLRPLVTTNGTKLTRARLAWLIENDFFLGFSMDGGAAAMAAARPFKSGRSSFEAVEASLDRLLESGYARYEVMMVVDPKSAPYLAEGVEYLIDKGVKRLAFNPNFFTPWDDEAKGYWRRGYQVAADAWADSYRRGEPLYVNFLDSKVITAVKGGFGVEDTCSFEGGELAVAPSGNMYPCERLVGDDRDPTWVIGHVDGGVSPAKTCTASSSCGNVDDECVTCPLQPRCMNWCGCTNYLESGAANRAGGNLCWHEKMAIPLADKVGSALYAEQNPRFLERFYFESSESPAEDPEPRAIAV
jgi:uncharacterized protein